MITCEFIQGTKKDPTGYLRHDIYCGKPAAKYQCEGELGELSAIVVSLCEFHKNFVVNQYKWKLQVVAS
jgi:hypothetical protein